MHSHPSFQPAPLGTRAAPQPAARGPDFQPIGRRRGSWLLVLLAHLLLLWGLVMMTSWRPTWPDVARVLTVALLAPSGAERPRAEPELRLAPKPAAPPILSALPPPVLPPLLPAAPEPRPAPAAVPAGPATATAEPTSAISAAPAASGSLPALAVPAAAARTVSPVERQVTIGQVEYLNPPALSYPLAAKRLREQGLVRVRLRVDERGLPDRIALAASSGSARLDEAALAAVRAIRFKPYSEDGVPLPFWVVIPLLFELQP